MDGTDYAMWIEGLEERQMEGRDGGKAMLVIVVARKACKKK
jgi:hypothetical protein